MSTSAWEALGWVGAIVGVRVKMCSMGVQKDRLEGECMIGMAGWIWLDAEKVCGFWLCGLSCYTVLVLAREDDNLSGAEDCLGGGHGARAERGLVDER
jgi:hypothetical protein